MQACSGWFCAGARSLRSLLPVFCRYRYLSNVITAMPKRKRGKEADKDGVDVSDTEVPVTKKNKKGGAAVVTKDKERGVIKPKKTKVEDEGKNKTDWEIIKWEELGTTKDERRWNKKLSSWNVNGVRAWLKNGGLKYIHLENPDIFCLQEIKCSESDLPMDQLNVDGYHSYWHSAEKKGYSGVGLYTKEKPLNVIKGIGIDKYDCEGRLITAEYEDFYFLTSYVPNAGEGLKRLSYKQEWDVDLREYMVKLDKIKPVILCGDLNVAHSEIDLKNPKTNHKTAGFTPEERKDFTLLLEEGFVDVFRQLYPDLIHAYTYWSYRFNARAKNTGWRLDYFVVSERFLKNVCDCVIRKEVFGSDHCPLVLSLANPVPPQPSQPAAAVEDSDTTTPDKNTDPEL